ncbi:MAG TPA: GMC family oxidoreductase [Sphingomicrobium sp.]|nr:GMC family oxidoreductase [Sphingomicrobium sp.]
MLIDLREEAPKDLQADVAIIGAGAAGHTLARSLLEKGLRVLLLESGGLDFEPDTAALNRGTNIGEPYYDLDRSRLRFFGGTTAIWGGRCAELDAIDLAHRPWVPFSGWPMTAKELQPWYKAARGFFGIGSTEAGAAPRLLDLLNGRELSVRHWWFDREFDRFGAARNRDLIEHFRCQVAIHATVRAIVPSPDVTSVDHLEVRSPAGRTHRAKARVYVLAAGGLENPRILLASNSVAAAGLGNAHDLVGRFFMEHPHARGGRIVGAPRWRILNSFRAKKNNGVEMAPLITLSEDAQRRESALNSGLTIAARPPFSGRKPMGSRAYDFVKHKTAPTDRGRALWRLSRRLGRTVKPLSSSYAATQCLTGTKELALLIRAEQAPNPDSRVTLTSETDASGMPRISLDWRLTRQDVESVAALVDGLGREARRTGLGTVEAAEWLRSGQAQWTTDPLISAHPIGGYHHMGTTRMADDPKRGVTDRWGRVHGIANLFVAGSSLFPTSGWANPTLTIVALALRTADRIAADNA